MTYCSGAVASFQERRWESLRLLLALEDLLDMLDGGFPHIAAALAIDGFRALLSLFGEYLYECTTNAARIICQKTDVWSHMKRVQTAITSLVGNATDLARIRYVAYEARRLC